MDYSTSTKFISSLSKTIQSLCHGYVNFTASVQLTGRLYLNVDESKSIEYYVDEKLCKTDHNKVVLKSNSFHAQIVETAAAATAAPNQNHAIEIKEEIVCEEENEIFSPSGRTK